MSNQQPPSLAEQPLKRLIRLLRLDKKEISYIFVYALFGGFIGLTIPLGVQAIINLIAIGQTSTSWVVLTFIIALATALVGLMKLMQFSITELLQQRIFTRSAFEFAYRIPRLQRERIREHYAPELANRFFDTLNVQKGIPKIVTDLPESALQIFFGLVLLALYHVFFLLFGIILILLLVAIILSTSKVGLKTSLSESKYKYKVAYWLEEVGRTMDSFKLAGETAYPLEKTNEYVEGYLHYRQKHFGILRWQLISIILLKTIATAALLLIGGLLVIHNEINIGQFVAAEIMIIIVLNSLEKIVVSMETVFDVLTAVEKIGAVLDLPLETSGTLDFKQVNQSNAISVQTNNLSYTPEGLQQPVLNNINLNIKAGEKVAITGMNSSGKTTLLKVLIGLNECYQGVLSYDQIPRNNIHIPSFRQFVGDYISEEHLFSASVEKNISMGRGDIPIKMVVDICEKIGLLADIQQLPNGFDTIIPSDGEGLSQSFIRKILLARCVVDNPKLIGTEPLLFGLENKEKQLIINTLIEGNWTLLAVTHHAHFAKRCDRILVLDKGTIIFEGVYSQLEQQPYFSQLFDDIN